MAVDDLTLPEDLALFEGPSSPGTVVLTSDFSIEAPPEQLWEYIDLSPARMTFVGVTLQISWNVSSSWREKTRHAEQIAFEREKLAFGKMLPDLRIRYARKFVAVHDGEVVDSDSSSAHLVRRFFERFGEMSVYIGYVGGRRVIRNISPRIRRP